jgi:hypothetical protein
LPGRENLGQDPHYAGGKIGGSQIGLKYGTLGGLGNFKKFLVGTKVMGKNTAGNLIGEKLLYGIGFSFFFQLSKVGNLPPAKKLYPLVGKILIKPHDGPHRPVEVRNVYFPGQPLPSADTMEVEGIVFLEINIDHVKDGKSSIDHALNSKGKTKGLQGKFDALSQKETEPLKSSGFRMNLSGGLPGGYQSAKSL